MLSIIPLYLLFVTFGLSVACSITLFLPHLWSLIPALTTYGKTSFRMKDEPQVMRIIAVPKKWFAHFYIFAVVNAGGWLLFAYQKSNGLATTPDFVASLLEKMTLVKPFLPWTTTITALLLILFHVYRRCYETLFVSVYSDSTMNIGHYIMGMVHYLLLPLTIVCEANGMANNRSVPAFSLSDLTYVQWLGILLFFYCNWEQHKVVRHMAALRKTPDGLASHYIHGIPYEGWFQQVSCPHFLFEIGIYLSIWMVVRGCSAYWYLLMFVIVNQTWAAQINHRWYKTTFPTYPITRKAIYPHLL